MDPYRELYHFGVKGMKWGVRRYLNPDGSLTDQGKKRYANASKQIIKRSTYSPSEVKALPRKERKATKRYLKDYKKSYRMETKAQYKKLGGKRGLRKIIKTSDGSMVNTKTGKKVDAKDHIMATRYEPRNIRKGLEYVSSAASIAAIMALSHDYLSRR